MTLEAEPARIDGGRCRTCGLVFAPYQPFGCERCGAYGDQLEVMPLAASGRLCSSAVVRVHRHPVPPTPFAVVEVALDAGPTVRALAADGVDALRPGMRMQARKVSAGDLLRFEPATEAQP